MLKELTEGEKIWVALVPFLRSRGYLLRRRYQPGWKPGSKEDRNDESLLHPKNLMVTVLDAVRVSDNRVVVMKKVESGSKEYTLHSKILTLQDSSEYFVPIYDVILLPDTDETFLIVLPLIRPIDRPTFENVYEALACILHLSEALAILHKNRIVHGDIDQRNIHMQADAMYPRGWHFLTDHRYITGDPTRSRSLLKTSPFIPRCLAPPTYLFMDFGNSVHFEKEQKSFVFAPYGTVSPPEMDSQPLVEAFAVDIWCFANMFQEIFSNSVFESYRTLWEQLTPWADEMLQENPQMRPTAQQALVKIRELIQSTNDKVLRRGLRPKYEWTYGELRYGMAALLKGEGDERVLFTNLKASKSPPEKITFTNGSIKDKFEILRKNFRLLTNAGGSGGVLEIIAPNNLASSKS